MFRAMVRCVWIMFEEDDFYEAVTLAHWLECEIAIDWSGIDGPNEQGYYILTVYLSAIDEKFLMTYGNTLNLYGYVECVGCESIDESLCDIGLRPLIAYEMGEGLEMDFSFACNRNRSPRG